MHNDITAGHCACPAQLRNFRGCVHKVQQSLVPPPPVSRTVIDSTQSITPASHVQNNAMTTVVINRKLLKISSYSESQSYSFLPNPKSNHIHFVNSHESTGSSVTESDSSHSSPGRHELCGTARWWAQQAQYKPSFHEIMYKLTLCHRCFQSVNPNLLYYLSLFAANSAVFRWAWRFLFVGTISQTPISKSRDGAPWWRATIHYCNCTADDLNNKSLKTGYAISCLNCCLFCKPSMNTVHVRPCLISQCCPDTLTCPAAAPSTSWPRPAVSSPHTPSLPLRTREP